MTPGILLCIATLLALVMENSVFYGVYDRIKDTPMVLQIGNFAIDKPILLWINDGLMAIFFLFIGLEIKREILQGHLSDRKQLTLPVVAAFGGVAVPSLIYAFINWHNPDGLQGWAIPAATDIAFSLGILMMFGNRIPSSLKICLVAIAIIDDLIAILIIALFYTAETSLFALSLAGIGLLIAFLFNKRGITKLGTYCILGLFIWACVLKSGVHATLAGVALGFIIPLNIRNKYGESPLMVMEKALYPWVSFAILPIFAFVNAGVPISNITIDTFTNPVTLGIISGLFIGKQVGIMGLTILATKLKLCRLPDSVTWLQYYGMALLMGVGFTMSLFIGNLAFSDISYSSAVRIGVLSASFLSAICGASVLFIANKKVQKEHTSSTL